MTKQTINVGTRPNDGSGDTIRVAFGKTNNNFTEVYNTAQAAFDTANTGGIGLGDFKISGSTLGTKGTDNAWGDSTINIDPGGESYSGIVIPSVPQQDNGASFTIYHNKSNSGSIQLFTSQGNWAFNQDGTMEFPSNRIDAGTSFVDLKSSNGVELWYSATSGTWQNDINNNESSYLWIDSSGTHIENYRGDDGEGGPIYDYQWNFQNDGQLKFASGNVYINKQRYGMGNVAATLDYGWTICEYNGTDYGTEGIRINPAVEGSADIYLPPNQTANTTAVKIANYDVGGVLIQSGSRNWTFDSNGKINLTTDGAIEPVGMGWTGLTNGTSGTPVSMVAKSTTGNWRASVDSYNSETYGTAGIYTVNAPGIPSGVQNWNGQGGWDQGSYTDLATTGGTGTGLTVDVVGGGGYIDINAITIHTPGTGYTDGDVITIDNENSLPGTFTLVVIEDSNQWTFDQYGSTILPGKIQGRVKTNTYTDTTIELDVNATINKLTPIGGGYAQHYHLADGVEGQIMYITLATGGETGTEYTILEFDNARYTNGAGYITEASNVLGWMPFRGGSTTSTLLFIDGHWNLTHAQFD